MTEPTYTFKCNLLVEPPKIDRFYMDMRVYSVIPSETDFDDNGQSLIWRGIYLAFEVEGAEQES
jgi:hypothetical protein